MSLLKFIKESLLFEASKLMNKNEIKDMIIHSKYANIFRDELDEKYTPEVQGEKTTLVLKKSGSNELCLNYGTSGLKFSELDGIIIDLGGEEIKRGSKDVWFLMPDGKELKCHYSGQTYGNTPGAGIKGTTDKNAGNAFERYVAGEPEKIRELIINIANKSGLKNINITDDTMPIHVGALNSRLGALGEKFLKTFNYSSLSNYSQKVADIQLGDANISLKKDTGVITLWNMGVDLKSKTHKDRAKEFMSFLIDDDEVRDMVDAALTYYYPNDSVLNKDEWEEIKRENIQLKKGKGITLDSEQLNIENIIKILQFSWKQDVYLVSGHVGGDLYGFYLDSHSLDQLIGKIKSAKLILPYTTKMVGIELETSTGVVYRISFRDRAGAGNFNAAEVVLPNGLHPKMMEKINLTGYSVVKM